MVGDALSMIGLVDCAGNAIVTVQVRGPHGATADILAIVDTGFNDWLTLSRLQIEAIGLPFREEVRYTLADGSERVSALFASEVEWLGRWRRILIAAMEGGPLLGMAMLRGCFLSIAVVDGGRVEIRPMSA
jgi:clan AA aspartic protease